MEKRKLNKSKVEGKAAGTNKNDTFSVIVKVNKADYIPEPVALRSKINPFMFTADADAAAIEHLEKDDSVSSVAISHPVPVID